MPIHFGSGRTVADVIDYVANPEKTKNGELISSFECDSKTADAEFALSKRQYAQLTGRSQGGSDIIAYHTRQAFHPDDDLTPGEANRIGMELALAFTKGKHSLVVCTHIDKNHIHNHIIFNSTALDCRHKFRNFIGSAFALRRVSDRICVEHGVSIIKNPKPSRGHYSKWLEAMGGDRPLSFQERLRQAIDAMLEKHPSDFEAFLAEMQAAGYEVKCGKYLAFKAPEQEKFTRCRGSTLGADYTEDAIRDRIAGRRQAPVRRGGIPKAPPASVSLLIDIQAKIQSGKGPRFERWAKVHNLKAMARTLIYLQEQGLDRYDILAEKSAAATARFNASSDRMKGLEANIAANASLQKHIIDYIKTRQTYIDYRKAGYSKKFKAEHETDILLHQAAKKAFDELGLTKIPTIKSLRSEYALLLEKKKKARHDYNQARSDMKELLVAKSNVDRFLGTDSHTQEREPDAQQR
ncbi:relaxase/mobilization nuclease domain-containing protein [Dehalobacter restrictus]